ncbi:MAG: hypothetical protein JJU40_05995 [Rhodobacteraceae bacterium]|nr:hypothetical protein [Paracoccaceae bacterium]
MPAPLPSGCTPSLRVTLRDVREARYCLAGVRPWFRRHGLDWQDFLAHGIDAARLRATGDGLVDPVIAAAEMREAVTAEAAEAAEAEAEAEAEVQASAPVTVAQGSVQMPTEMEPSHGG